MGFYARDWRYDQEQQRWPASIQIEQYHRTQEHEEWLRMEAFSELQRYRAMVDQVTNSAFHSSFPNFSGPTIADSWKTRRWYREPFRALANMAGGSSHLSSSHARYSALVPARGNAVVGGVDGTKAAYLQLLEQEKQRLGMVDDAAEQSKQPVASKPSQEKWRELLEKVKHPGRSANQKRLLSEIEYNSRKLEALQLTREKSVLFANVAKPEKEIEGAFDSLSPEAEKRVEDALTRSDRHKVLVMHENSNIDISGTVIRCLLPGAWLNDEVINLYMELLKERELREPQRFLKCHFFNTFFYNKLFKDKQRYDYKAVRRWTTQRKIGYLLFDCDKILVPVHQDIHWCLAVINIRERKVEYLDSLKGGDPNVLKVLSQYFVDEVKDKSGQDMDVSNWDLLYPDDIPEQLNGCDCGMFMLKYADFHSRGAAFCFSQTHMDYFRKKTAWEILQLAAT